MAGQAQTVLGWGNSTVTATLPMKDRIACSAGGVASGGGSWRNRDGHATGDNAESSDRSVACRGGSAVRGDD